MGHATQGSDASVFVDDFDTGTLNLTTWMPSYLPAWSSRAASAAAWEVSGTELRLTIPPRHPVWCEGDHDPPIRVSGLQTGNFSGPKGSPIGQQPYRQGLLVREEQAPFQGWTPQGGVITIRARATIPSNSMFSFWLIGTEIDPAQCAEICIVELFGNAIHPDGSADVGSGVHAFRDPDAVEDFATTRRMLDPTVFHEYSVDWTSQHAIASIDGVELRRVERPPFYPMQLMIAVFDFPASRSESLDVCTPELSVDWITWRPSGSSQ